MAVSGSRLSPTARCGTGRSAKCGKMSDMESYRDDPDARVWEVSFADLSGMPTDLQTGWASALRAVAHDLGCMQGGRKLETGDLVWDLEVAGGRWVSVGVHSPGRRISRFLVSRDYALDASATQCILWVAEAVQDHVTGYEYMLWPSVGSAVCVPRLVNEKAMWVNPKTGAQVAEIGKLGAE